MTRFLPNLAAHLTRELPFFVILDTMIAYCKHCGKQVERETRPENATCFDCREKRQLKRKHKKKNTPVVWNDETKHWEITKTAP